MRHPAFLNARAFKKRGVVFLCRNAIFYCMKDEEIRHLAALARIRIAEADIPKIADKLARVVQYVSEIKDIAPELQGGVVEADELRNVMREDGTPHETGMYTEDILASAPERDGDYFKVKKIL